MAIPAGMEVWVPGKIWHDDSYDAINPSRPELSFRNKKVVVTGGGYGIGKEIARAFGTAGAAEIFILGRKQGPLEQTQQELQKEFPEAKVAYLIADVTNEEQLTAAAERVKSWDALVMNAGYLPERSPVAKASTKEWWLGFEINVLGPFLTTKAFMPHHNKDAAIIGVSTMGAVFPAKMLTGLTSYVASKAAMTKFMEIFAAENPDVQTIAIHPGAIETDMYEKSEMAGKIHVSKIALPAHFTVWAASPEAKFLHGKFVSVNYDVGELKAQEKELESSNLLELSYGGFPFKH